MSTWMILRGGADEALRGRDETPSSHSRPPSGVADGSEAAIRLQLKKPRATIGGMPPPARRSPRRAVPIVLLFPAMVTFPGLLVSHTVIIIVLHREAQWNVGAGRRRGRRERHCQNEGQKQEAHRVPFTSLRPRRTLADSTERKQHRRRLDRRWALFLAMVEAGSPSREGKSHRWTLRGARPKPTSLACRLRRSD